MKKYILALIMMPIVSGCANDWDEIQIIEYEGESREEISPYVDFFIKYFNSEGCRQSFRVKISFSFHEIKDNNLLGLCRRTLKTSSGGKKRIDGEIQINPRRWKELSENSKKTLVSHELGHCLLGAKHDENNVIMQTYHSPVNFEDKQNIDLLINLIKRHCER